MTADIDSEKRLNYFDALRGLAALQVVFLHFLTALAPTYVSSTPHGHDLGSFVHMSALSFLYDGHSAVPLFFLLSGYVLTGVFSRAPANGARALSSRMIRLGVPALASCGFSALCFLFFGGLNVQVGQLTNSPWFSGLWHPDLSVLDVFRDGVLNALFLGYEGKEPLGALLPAWAQDSSKSYNIPLWSLSVEFYGSFFVIVLCWLNRRFSRTWLFLIIVFSLCFARSYYICFAIGHLLANRRAAESAPVLWPRFAAIMICGGVLICVTGEFYQAGFLRRVCGIDINLWFPCESIFDLQKTIGAIFVFVGVIQWSPARLALSHPGLAWIGRLSFPIYLIHFPVLFGFGSFLFLSAYARIGAGPAAVVAFCGGLAITGLAAVLFANVDRWAVRLSRGVRQRARVGGPSSGAASVGRIADGRATSQGSRGQVVGRM